MLAVRFLSGLAGTFSTLLRQGVVIQLALFTQDFRQATHCIGEFLFLGRQVFRFAIGLLARQARHSPRTGLAFLKLQILQHVRDVRKELPGLVACAGLGQVLQGVQHVLEILPAQVGPARCCLLVHRHLRLLVAIGQCLGHLGGEIFIGRIAEGFHALLDLAFRRAVAQRLFQCAPRSLKASQCICRAAIFGAQGQCPEQGIDLFGVLFRGSGIQNALGGPEGEVDTLIADVAFTLIGHGVQHQCGLLDVRRRGAKPVGGGCIDGILSQGGIIFRQFGIVARLAKNGHANLLGHAGNRVQEELFGQLEVDRFAQAGLARPVCRDKLQGHGQA